MLDTGRLNVALYAFDVTWNKERDAGEYGKSKALALKLPLATDCIGSSCTSAKPSAVIGENLDPIANRPRSIGAGDRIHYTVTPRAAHVNPPDSCGRETEATERLAP
jgi:hypothetical protein